MPCLTTLKFTTILGSNGLQFTQLLQGTHVTPIQPRAWPRVWMEGGDQKGPSHGKRVLSSTPCAIIQRYFTYLIMMFETLYLMFDMG